LTGGLLERRWCSVRLMAHAELRGIDERGFKRSEQFIARAKSTVGGIEPRKGGSSKPGF
jgi:hypothetical protein